jgi:hypothetical protein
MYYPPNLYFLDLSITVAVIPSISVINFAFVVLCSTEMSSLHAHEEKDISPIGEKMLEATDKTSSYQLPCRTTQSCGTSLILDLSIFKSNVGGETQMSGIRYLRYSYNGILIYG